MIDESRALRMDPEFSQNFIESLATAYNLASDYTSLLLLHSAIQFIENDLTCPEFHPEFPAWKEMKALQETDEEIKKVVKDIERLEKLQSIEPLAQQLAKYFTGLIFFFWIGVFPFV
jgi:hypothetical protein